MFFVLFFCLFVSVCMWGGGGVLLFLGGRGVVVVFMKSLNWKREGKEGRVREGSERVGAWGERALTE